MTVLVFLVGLVLALAGGFAIFTGAPIIQVERGWAEVIAGAAALSGGVVTLALGVVAFKIGHLQRAVLASAMQARLLPALASDEPELQPVRNLQVPADDERSDVGSLGSAEHPAELELVGEASLRPALLPDHPADAIATAPAVDIGLADHHGEARAEPILSVTPDETPENLPAVDAPARRLTALAPDLVPIADAPSPSAPLSRDWLSRPLLRARSSRAPDPAPAPDIQPDEAAVPLVDAPAATTAPTEVEERIEPAVEHAPANPVESTVIGRYKSGASSYTMFSDGAIEVETETGDSHRFGSMDELKAFIARQERELS